MCKKTNIGETLITMGLEVDLPSAYMFMSGGSSISMHVYRSMQSHSAASSTRRNEIQRATKNVKYGNIGCVERLIKGKPL